jgi:uncharacterized membrane protein YkoI
MVVGNAPDERTFMTTPEQKGFPLKRWLAAPLMVGALAGGYGLASAQTDTPSTTDSTAAAADSQVAAQTDAQDGATTTTVAPAAADDSPSPTVPAAGPTDTRRGGGSGETALTGETADKVKAAALKAVPGGTVDRVETDSDGSPYEAHVTKADGSHVTVKVNEAFEVTSIEADQGRGGPGHGRGGPGNGETALTGETADKVKAAALEAVPGGTVDRVETDSDGSPYEAHMTKADGSHVTVKVNEAFEVTSVDADNHGGRPGDGQRPA